MRKILFLSLLFSQSVLFGSTAGPNAPGTVADDGGAPSIGTIVWINPNNAKVSDDTRAEATMGAGQISHYLKCTNFGFSIPTGATIDGIEVAVEKVGGRSGSSEGATDETVQLLIGGSLVGVNRATPTEWPVFTDAVLTYGGSSDLWTLTPTATQLNDSGFGVVISANWTDSTGIAGIDLVTITVYYHGGSALHGGIETNGGIRWNGISAR